VHLAVLGGAAAGIYAVTLAGVTGLQAETDARLAAAREPIAAAIARQRAAHERLEAAVEAAGATYGSTASRYAALLESVAAHEADIAALATEVAAAEGSAATLVVPARPALPSVTGGSGVRPAPRPPTNASTGASGG
jgi:hypothetical protein